MKISGTWAPQVINGVMNYLPHIFHIQDKNVLREMIDKDPSATGSTLLFFLRLKFDRRLARTTEKDEQPVPNEEFFIRFLDEYDKVYKSFKPGMVEKQIKNIATDFFIALDRVDLAYYERIGGIVTYLIVNHKDKFADVNANHINALIDVYEWWQEVDYRKRTRNWIDWGFRLAINKYKTNVFWFKSINYFLLWINKNGHMWMIDDRYNPDKWFGYGRGLECNLLHGEEW